MAAGHVFISYARADRVRVRRFADKLADRAGVAVFVDEQIQPGVAWRDALQDQLQTASCTVVVWTRSSVRSRFVRDEASRALDAGTLVPVKLDADAVVPLGFGELQFADLTGSASQQRRVFSRLVERVQALVMRGPAPNRWNPSPLAKDEWVVGASQGAVGEIRAVTGRLRTATEILASEPGAAAEVLAALDEVGKTYRVVDQALHDFVAPALASGALSPEPYLAMERSLAESIRTGRGHCGQIAMHYGRVGGLRDALAPRASRRVLREADESFGRLSTADNDLFRQLEQIGGVLQEESRSIVNLLIGGHDREARRRVAAGREKLQPLENELDAAMEELHVMQETIGYARST